MIPRVPHPMTPCHLYIRTPRAPPFCYRSFRRKQKLPANLPAVSTLQHITRPDPPESLHDTLENVRGEGTLDVLWLSPQTHGPDHAEDVVQRAGRVCVDRVRTGCFVGVHFD